MPRTVRLAKLRRLSGGRRTSGVVQVGATVRRPRSERSDFIARVLKHLEIRNFKGAPRYLGRDDWDRDVLSFLPGEVPKDLGVFSSQQLSVAAKLLRSLHDATAGFASGNSQKVVCHGDASPCNCVFQDSVPYALIDFDDAYVGPRDLDIWYAAWLCLEIGDEDLLPEAQASRLKSFFDSYGFKHLMAPFDAVIGAQERHLANSTPPPPAVRHRIYPTVFRSPIARPPMRRSCYRKGGAIHRRFGS
jgi:hypothetical protein